LVETDLFCVNQPQRLLLDGELISDFVRTTDDVGSLGGHGLLLLDGVHRSPERDGAVLRDDLDVVSIGRERLISDDRLADIACDLEVRFVFRLLISGSGVIFVSCGVVGSGLGGRRTLILGSCKDRRSAKQKERAGSHSRFERREHRGH